MANNDDEGKSQEMLYKEAIAKIRFDLAWKSRDGTKEMGHVVLTRGMAKAVLAKCEGG